jgi:hypothetical protein
MRGVEPPPRPIPCVRTGCLTTWALNAAGLPNELSGARPFCMTACRVDAWRIFSTWCKGFGATSFNATVSEQPGTRAFRAFVLVPGAGVEPACRTSPARHFKCLVSTSFTTRAVMAIRTTAIMPASMAWLCEAEYSGRETSASMRDSLGKQDGDWKEGCSDGPHQCGRAPAGFSHRSTRFARNGCTPRLIVPRQGGVSAACCSGSWSPRQAGAQWASCGRAGSLPLASVLDPSNASWKCPTSELRMSPWRSCRQQL